MTQSAQSQKDIQLDLEGINCASCVNHTEKAILSVDGVESAVVNLATKKANIALKDNQAPSDIVPKIIKAVQDAGYGVVQDSISLDVEGMTCASCVRHVEKALSSVPGVEKATVNLATNSAHVDFISGTVSFADLEKAVADSGYDVKKK